MVDNETEEKLEWGRSLSKKQVFIISLATLNLIARRHIHIGSVGGLRERLACLRSSTETGE